MKDPNQVVKIEKAIADKYGTETILNPKSLWNEDKEKEYQEQIKELQQKQLFIEENSHKVEIDGVFISKKLLNKDSKRTCPVCSIYSFSLEDDIYMNKFECCKICYVKYIEDREERWKSGWRPSKDANNKVKT
jgi:hypothetical protein